MADEDEITKLLLENSEILEENDKMNFITCSIADSVRGGGSVLIPIEQALTFTNAIPEWLCKKRQQKLFCGEPLFGHVELGKARKLHVHEDLRHICTSRGGKKLFQFLFYSMTSTLRVPNLKDDFGGRLMTDLATQLQPRRLTSKEMAIARLRAKVVLKQGRVLVVCPKKPSLANSRMLLWGYVDAVQLLAALKAKGMNCSIVKKDEVTVLDDDSRSIRILVSEEAVIETSATRTVICTKDAALAKLIYEILRSVCDGI
ncbi:hypothetical protein KSP40_PGU013943 [Platanthera guangdongensis]|uniref:Uncharacterized protein n=1 Tax=Platanthera guangdongensis TaxID=2320717 RepID=A0ABR2MCP9_9ASPA